MRNIILALLFVMPAQAERLIASLSNHRVVITSSFTGAELVLYGLIERDAMTIGRGSGYDVIAVMRGENETFVVREKSRDFGLWLNRAKLTLPPVPNALGLFANRPIKDIAESDLRKSNLLGLDALLPQMGSDPSRLALIRLQKAKGLYFEIENGVTFLTPSWFRTRIRLPSQIPTGQYRVDVFLLTGGVIVARSETAFEVVKSGVESFISRHARDNAWIYGIITALIALLSGFLGHLIFRKD
jgi:uncharacterized protein (TIGR02186 family)